MFAHGYCSWSKGLRSESDVSSAFDRVSRIRLCDKLEATGLHPDAVGFLASWLEDRISQVVLGGASSAMEPLTDSVFQGTVLGASSLEHVFRGRTASAEQEAFQGNRFR